MDKYKFGEFLYQKRKKIGLTQEELGRKLGVTNKAVSKWEVGETLPEVTMLEPLANLLGITVDELLTQRDKISSEIKFKNSSIKDLCLSYEKNYNGEFLKILKTYTKSLDEKSEFSLDDIAVVKSYTDEEKSLITNFFNSFA